jgi:hypothetical protein
MKWKLNKSLLRNPNSAQEGVLFCGIFDENERIVCHMEEEMADKYGKVIANSNELYIAVKVAIEASNSNGRFKQSVVENLRLIINKIED